MVLQQKLLKRQEQLTQSVSLFWISRSLLLVQLEFALSSCYPKKLT